MATGKQRKANDNPMFFSAFNYKLIGIAILLIVSGFTAMYLENEIDGVISLYVSPLVILAGYVVVIFAIMKHDRPQESDSEATAWGARPHHKYPLSVCAYFCVPSWSEGGRSFTDHYSRCIVIHTGHHRFFYELVIAWWCPFRLYIRIDLLRPWRNSGSSAYSYLFYFKFFTLKRSYFRRYSHRNQV